MTGTTEILQPTNDSTCWSVLFWQLGTSTWVLVTSNQGNDIVFPLHTYLLRGLLILLKRIPKIVKLGGSGFDTSAPNPKHNRNPCHQIRFRVEKIYLLDIIL